MRLFVAIDLPHPQSVQLAKLCRGIDCARWVSEERMHLTLRFIGETEEAKVDGLRLALEQVRFAAFTARLQGAGTFGGRQAKVLWAGVEPRAPFAELRKQVNEALASAGAPVDTEPEFQPHITLARFKTPPREELERWLKRNGDIESESWQVQAFSLYASQLGPKGAAHTELATFKARS